jgi:hypothetical protein
MNSVTAVTLRFTYALRYGWHFDYVTLRPPIGAYVRNARNAQPVVVKEDTPWAIKNVFKNVSQEAFS